MEPELVTKEQVQVGTRRVKRLGRPCACLFGQMTAGGSADGRAATDSWAVAPDSCHVMLACDCRASGG